MSLHDANLFNKAQHGAVLVVSLIFLLLLTMIGVTAMQNATFETKMGDNARQRILAFQYAEAALRAGENALRQAVPANPNAQVSTGNCDITTYWIKGHCWSGSTTMNCAASPPTASTTTCTSGAVQISSLNASLTDQPYEQPRYFIERLITLSGTGSGSLELGKPQNQSLANPSLYRITALGFGNTSDAVVILQTTYQR